MDKNNFYNPSKDPTMLPVHEVADKDLVTGTSNLLLHLSS